MDIAPFTLLALIYPAYNSDQNGGCARKVASMRRQQKQSHVDLSSGMSMRGENRGETKRREERRERRGEG